MRRIACQALWDADSHSIAGVAGVLLYEAGDVIQAGATEFSGVVSGEPEVRFASRHLVVEKVDMVHIAVHSRIAGRSELSGGAFHPHPNPLPSRERELSRGRFEVRDADLRGGGPEGYFYFHSN